MLLRNRITPIMKMTTVQPARNNKSPLIAFNCFMTQDNYLDGVTSYIPPEIRERMGTWIHGCDICQEVCPRNQKRLKTKLPQSDFWRR